MTALALVVALAVSTPLVDGVRAVPENDYVCPDLPGDNAGQRVRAPLER